MSTMWIPQPKVIEGKEEVYRNITDKILNIYQTDEVVVDDSNNNPEIQKLVEQLSTITVTPYETLNIPVIGEDQTANAYFLQKSREVYPKQFNPKEIIEKMSGHHAIGMAQDTDGISVYRPEDEQVYVFDAGLMVSYLTVVGPGILLESGFNKTAEQSIDFGERLQTIANGFISEHNVEFLRDQQERPNEDSKDGHKMVHYLLAASSWLIFWGSNGHGIEVKAD